MKSALDDGPYFGSQCVTMIMLPLVAPPGQVGEAAFLDRVSPPLLTSGQPQERQERRQVPGVAELGVHRLHPHPGRLKEAIQGDVVPEHR
ncbi:hypothetical protein ACTWQF_10335 [Streptomyces sp. 8N114]|uniref:hypothetical protein n=1 Tax=Streptomyces sp. 8N114 TaxID=3457419 RepID=UPI003FD47B7E